MPINHIPIEKDIEHQKYVSKESKCQFFMTNPRYCFEDIILADAVKEKINRVLSFAQNHKLIFEEWRLNEVIKNYNLNINLHGASGTGKTMTAHAIANALGKQLIIVNYAEIESKYVGETSKNLVKLFEVAEQKDAVVLFDEADALLSRRVTAMHSATDVSVNQTRNTLLKILDEYKGIIIFTTNFIQNFDVAFIRRIFTHIKFDLPDLETRKKMWDHYLVLGLPMSNREEVIDEISQYDDLSGGDISTAVLKSAIDAANSREKRMDLSLLIKAIAEIKEEKQTVDCKYEVATRKVSQEYALKQINGGIINGIN